MGSFIETLSSRVNIQFTMGTVFIGYDQVKEMNVAVKQISLPNVRNGIPNAILREISVLKGLDHNNVVRLLDVITTLTDLGLVFEYIDYTLEKIMRKQAEPRGPVMVKVFLYQILDGLAHCHSQRVIHGNLNMQNLLINESTYAIKIGGFGFSRTFDAISRPHTPEVTASFAYKAPEVLLRLNHSAAADIWAVGCIFVEMVNKEPLLNGTTANECLSQMIRVFGVPSQDEWPGIKDLLKQYEHGSGPSNRRKPTIDDIVPVLPPVGIDLLSEMLCMVPERRISAHDALKHPYFENVDLSLIGPRRLYNYNTIHRRSRWYNLV